MKQMIDKGIYVEIYEVIKNRNEFASKLPDEIVKHIKKNACSTGYKFEYDKTKDIFSQIKRETLIFCISLYLKYVASDEEKEKFKTVLIGHEIEYKRNQGTLK